MDAETIEKYFDLQEMVQYDLKDDEIVILHQYTKQLLAARRPKACSVSEQCMFCAYEVQHLRCLNV